jgi:ABC-type phosphate transport system substrate-binding protein
MKRFLLLLFGCCLWLGSAQAGVVVVANANVRKLDLATVQRIYTGKVVEVNGVSVAPVNLQQGQGLRQRFLAEYMQQSDDTSLAYWTVRRYVGKGAPPREFASVAEVIAYVLSTPGAIAYLEETDVPASMNTVLKK